MSPDPKSIEAVAASLTEAPPHTPPTKRVLLGLVPCVLCVVAMFALLLVDLVVKLTSTALDGLARIAAFGAYHSLGTTPPAGKWPRTKV